MTRSLKPRDLHANASRPLRLADEGFFWVGTERTRTVDGQHIASGQLYVEYRVPEVLTQPWPIVMIHGGGGQGLDMLGTPDGRPGWVRWFLERGFAVYLVDRHGHGRAPFHPDALGPMTALPTYEAIASRFSAPRESGLWPRAERHTQWPGTGRIGDPALDQFMAGTGPAMANAEASHAAMGRCGAELLALIGPAILLTHSAGGPSGWMIGDAAPDRVKGIIAVEPLGPPFAERGGVSLDWGLTAAPLHFEPPATSPADLSRVMHTPDDASLSACERQADPPRRLPQLCGYPIVVVTAEASWMAHDNHGVVDFLAQAGASVEHLRLEDHGIHGNGHAMMLEKNSDSIAGRLFDWLVAQELAG